MMLNILKGLVSRKIQVSCIPLFGDRGQRITCHTGFSVSRQQRSFDTLAAPWWRVNILPSKLDGKRILFVDDERAIRETLSPILRKYGFTVTVSATVAHALNEIQGREFDLLLCDLNLEREGDGLDVIRAMRKVNPRCVIFILTAYPAVDSAVEAINLAVDGYITKPANADALVASLAEKLFAKQIKNMDYKVVHADLPVKTRSERPETSEPDGDNIH